MVKAGSSSSVSSGAGDLEAASNGGKLPTYPPHQRKHGGAQDFFNFYAQLQQSCQYYSNLALRQMMVGYQHPVRVGEVVLNKRQVGGIGDLERSSYGDSSFNADCFRAKSPPPTRALKKPMVKVVVSEYDADDNETDVAVNAGSFLRRRKVNFADPLSTIKIKSPTPIHSMEELHGGNGDSSRTGFTSDSEIDGSDTDLFCNYVWRIQNGLPGQLQVPSQGAVDGGGKKRKKRKKRKSKANRQEAADDYSYDNDTWPVEEFDKDDPNAFYEMPVNEDNYEFISDIRLCGPPVEKPKEKASPNTAKTGSGAGNVGTPKNKRVSEMKLLYGDTGSARILKMENSIEQCFMEALKKVGGRKQ